MKKTVSLLILLISLNLFSQTDNIDFQKVVLNYNNGKYKSALEGIEKLITKNNDNVEFYLFKSEILFQLELYDEVINTLNYAVKKFPNNHSARIKRGLTLLSFNLPREAIEDFNKSLEFATEDSLKLSSYINLSAAKSWKRDFEGAYEDLQKAYKIDSLHIGILTNLAMVSDEVNRGSETLGYLFKVISIDSTYTPAYSNIGFKLQLMGEYEKSIEYFNKAIALEPELALAFSNRSFSKLKLNDIKGAIEDINKSLKIYPENSYAYKIKALIYIEKKDFKTACENLELAQSKKYKQTYGNEVEELIAKYCE
jgi:tetratricopeptide (TPR) repeat protein